MDLLNIILIPIVVGVVIVVIGLVIEYWVIQPMRNSNTNGQLQTRIIQKWQRISDFFVGLLQDIRNLHRGIILLIGICSGVILFWGGLQLSSKSQSISSSMPTLISTPPLSPTTSGTQTPTSVVARPSQTPTNSVSPTSIPATVQPTEPKQPETPIITVPPPGFGILSFKVFKGCDTQFALQNGDNRVGEGKTSEKTYIAPGIYNLILWKPHTKLLGSKPDFGWEDLKISESITINEGEETVVNLTQKLGTLLLKGYPNLDEPLEYLVYDNENNSSSGFIDQQYCLPPGSYGVAFRSYQYMFGENANFNVDIKAGENNIVSPDTWPKPPGLLTFKTKNGTSTSFRFEVYDEATSTKIGNGTYNGKERYWISSGTYRIDIITTYIDKKYNDVEIKPGENKILDLP
jgi:hypothetical protein